MIGPSLFSASSSSFIFDRIAIYRGIECVHCIALRLPNNKRISTATVLGAAINVDTCARIHTSSV